MNLEPAAHALLYWIDAHRPHQPQADGRCPSFLEYQLDPVRFIVIFEHVSILGNEPNWFELDRGFWRAEYDSLDEVMRRLDLTHFDMGLATTKCSMTPRELIDAELMFRGLEKTVDVEEQDGLVSFQIGATRHSNIADFQTMYDVVRWDGPRFANDVWRPRWKDPWHE
jgi:hypothetical protein